MANKRPGRAVGSLGGWAVTVQVRAGYPEVNMILMSSEIPGRWRVRGASLLSVTAWEQGIRMLYLEPVEGQQGMPTGSHLIEAPDP